MFLTITISVLVVGKSGRSRSACAAVTPVRRARNADSVDVKMAALRAHVSQTGHMADLEERTLGAVLAFVSKPGYDPNLFVDGIDGTLASRFITGR